MHLKMSSTKCLPFCPGGYELIHHETHTMSQFADLAALAPSQTHPGSLWDPLGHMHTTSIVAQHALTQTYQVESQVINSCRLNYKFVEQRNVLCKITQHPQLVVCE